MAWDSIEGFDKLLQIPDGESDRRDIGGVTRCADVGSEWHSGAFANDPAAYPGAWVWPYYSSGEEACAALRAVTGAAQ